jgi:hypothetical protein
MSKLAIRSPKETVQGVVYMARLIDKIRLSLKGELPQEYEEMRGRSDGRGFDALFCDMLGFDYKGLEEQIRNGADDDSAVNWVWRVRGLPSEWDKRLWNNFMLKFGLNDEMSEMLIDARKRYNLSHREDIITFADLLDADEGRF